MNWLSEKVIRRRKAILVIAGIITAVMVACALQVRINYNMADYLPEDANSTQAIEVMAEEFNDSISNAQVGLFDVSVDEVLDYKQKIEQVDHVENVGWIDASMEVDQLKAILLEDGSVNEQYVDARTKKTIEGYYKGKNAMLQVTITSGYEKQGVNDIYKVIGKKHAIIGNAVEQAVSQNIAVSQSMKAILILAPLIILILILSTESWIEPFLYLTTIGVAAGINLGLNLIRGEISYVTLAVAPILQLAVSLDYAVFLSHSFTKYRNKNMEPENAMKMAMKDSLKSISASCLTTLFGFVALLFMKFKIGPDMGISLVAGVALSFLAVMIVLPAFILTTYRLNDKCRHRPLLPSFQKLGELFVHGRYLLLLAGILVLIPAMELQKENTFLYGSGEATEGSRLAEDEEKIEDIFGKNNMVALLVPRGNEKAEEGLAQKLEKLDYVTDVMSYANVIGADVDPAQLPEGTTERFYSDRYARIILTTTLETEGKEAFAAVEEIKDIVGSYYDMENVYLCGNSVNMYDMKACVEADNQRVSMITMIAIFVILLVEFRSLLLPVLLILVVKGSIWITMAMSAMTNEPVCYIGYLVVSTVMMGATIDYAILITDEYIKNRKEHQAVEAMKKALKGAMRSIMISASTLAIAGFSLGLTSSESIVRLLGMMLGKGAVVAFVLSVTLLPAILVLADQWIPYCSLGLGYMKQKKEKSKETENYQNIEGML